MTQIVKNDIKKKERPFLEIHKNSYYAKIFKCCMSCDHKDINSKGERYCKVNKKIVQPYDKCNRWVLAIGLERAGAGGGKVNLHCHEEFLEKRKQLMDETSKQETSINQ